jgi:hypothetical protein
MADLFRVADTLRTEPHQVRVRFGTVESVETDRTLTVNVGGGSVSGVQYAASMTPCPGKVAFLLTDGRDLFAVDHMAAEDLTLAPRVHRTSALSIANTTETAVTWEGVNSDAWGCWASGSPTYVSAPITGRYQATAYVQFAGDTDGFRQAWVRKNGTDILGYVKVLSAASGSPTDMTVATPAFTLAKGEYIELVVRHNAGNAIDLNRETDKTPTLSLIYIGP